MRKLALVTGCGWLMRKSTSILAVVALIAALTPLSAEAKTCYKRNDETGKCEVKGKRFDPPPDEYITCMTPASKGGPVAGIVMASIFWPVLPMSIPVWITQAKKLKAAKYIQAYQRHELDCWSKKDR